MSVAEFKLDLARAITEQLIEQFDRLDQTTLRDDALGEVLNTPGVYLLYHKLSLVYVGKSDSDLRRRLERHSRTIDARMNISLGDISFKALQIDRNWSALTTERELIRHYGDTPWNFSGFGNNDPGRNRDKSVVKQGHFDSLYPINLDYKIQLESGEYDVGYLLKMLKKELPYLFRYENLSSVENARPIRINSSGPSVRDIAAAVGEQLGPEWQITALPGRLIMYRESTSYKHGSRLWPIPD